MTTTIEFTEPLTDEEKDIIENRENIVILGREYILISYGISRVGGTYHIPSEFFRNGYSGRYARTITLEFTEKPALAYPKKKSWPNLIRSVLR